MTTPASASPPTPAAGSPASRSGRDSPPGSTAGAFPPKCLTDNGAVFTGKQRGQGRVTLEVQLGLRGDPVSHSRPYHPQTCGKVERFHQTQKKWLAAQPGAATVAGLQRQLDRFTRYYNNVRPHRALNRRTPAQAYAARPKAIPTGPIIPAHYRIRQDRIDTGGSVTVRHNCRLHHIGLGARLAGTPVTLLIDNLHIRVIHRHTGQLIRELTLDPTRDYQPRGLPPGPPKRVPAATPPPASRSRPTSAARSRSQGWPQATRRAPALTPARTAPPSISRDAETTPQMQRCLKTPVNGVSRHHRVELRGFEPLTSSMPWKRATNCAKAPRGEVASDSSARRNLEILARVRVESRNRLQIEGGAGRCRLDPPVAAASGDGRCSTQPQLARPPNSRQVSGGSPTSRQTPTRPARP